MTDLTGALWRLRHFGRVNSLRHLVTASFRLVLRDGTVSRIPLGPLRGYSWLNSREHPFWMPLGLYEQETATWLANNVGRGQTALDVGANAGYFTLLLAHVVGACGQVVAFEPVPLNVRVIEEQIRLNKLARTHLEAIALTDTTGELSFVVERTNANSHLEQVEIQHAVSRPEKVVKVQAERLDDWVARTDMTPDLIKVDVEGGEARLLEGAKQLLARQQTRWLVSTHSAELRTAVFGTFVSAGYDVSSLRGFEHEVVAIPTRP